MNKKVDVEVDYVDASDYLASALVTNGRAMLAKDLSIELGALDRTIVQATRGIDALKSRRRAILAKMKKDKGK
jgi:hypothetical protein